MKINAINGVQYYNKPEPAPSSKQQNFKGTWIPVGYNYLNGEYCAEIFYKFTDGKALTTFVDKQGHILKELGDNGMTVAEGKLAWKALFEDLKSKDGYIALKKLRAFILPNYDPKGCIYLEKDDSALNTAERKLLDLTAINHKIREFEINNGMVPKPAPEPFIKRHQEPMTVERFIEQFNQAVDNSCA